MPERYEVNVSVRPREAPLPKLAERGRARGRYNAPAPLSRGMIFVVARSRAYPSGPRRDAFQAAKTRRPSSANCGTVEGSAEWQVMGLVNSDWRRRTSA